MASAALTPLPTDDYRPGALAKWFMPWLLSTASHLVLILALALLVEKHRGVGDHTGSNDGILLTSVQSGPVSSAGGASAIQVAYFQDEESSAAAAESAASTATSTDATAEADTVPEIKIHDKGELAALFDQPPPVDLSDLVAASTANRSEGASGAAAEVPSAASMIRVESANSGSGRGEGSGEVVGDGAGPVGLGETLANGAARTGVFGVSGTGYKFVYVFDRSGSMDGHGGTPLATAKSELIHSLHELDRVHQFQIIFYNEHPRIFTLSGNAGRLAFGTDQNKRLAERFVGGITADGATQHEEALVLALQLNPDVIFFLTDADEPSMSAKQLDRIARRNNGTTINAIEFGYGPQADSDNFLVKLARQNGGQHAYVDVSELPRP